MTRYLGCASVGPFSDKPCNYNAVIEMVIVRVFIVISRLDVTAGDIRVWR